MPAGWQAGPQALVLADLILFQILTELVIQYNDISVCGHIGNTAPPHQWSQDTTGGSCMIPQAEVWAHPHTPA